MKIRINHKQLDFEYKNMSKKLDVEDKDAIRNQTWNIMICYKELDCEYRDILEPVQCAVV